MTADGAAGLDRDQLVAAILRDYHGVSGAPSSGEVAEAKRMADVVQAHIDKHAADGAALAQFARWLVAMGDPNDADGMRARQTVTLTSIIGHAKDALRESGAVVDRETGDET